MTKKRQKIVLLILLVITATVQLFADDTDSFHSHIYRTYRTTDNVRLRKGAGTDSEIITTIKAGSPVQLLFFYRHDYLNIDGISSCWVEVKTTDGTLDRDGNPIPKGTEGYLYGGYITLTTIPDDLFKTWISLRDKDLNPDSTIEDAFKFFLADMCKEKSFTTLQKYIMMGDEAGQFPYSPLIPIIKYDWKEAFDYVMESKWALTLANQADYSGKMGEYSTHPFEMTYKYPSPNSLYYAEKLIDLGININTYIGTGFTDNQYNPPDNYLTLCTDDAIKQLLLEHGIATTYKVSNWNCKAYLTNGAITLYETREDLSSGFSYTPESDTSFEMTEIGFERFENTDNIPAPKNYSTTNRWIKVTDGTVTGWVYPHYLSVYSAAP